MTKKVLIVGNHTCGNRGDAAILRGLITELRQQIEGVELEIISRFPDSSIYLLGEDCISDDLLYKQLHGGFGFSAMKKAKLDALDLKILESNVRGHGLYRKLAMPKKYQATIDKMKSFDAVIQVGGSFFVDSYGVYQFEYPLCALASGVPLLLVGHSVGPFSGERFNALAELVFNRASFLGLREKVSEQLLLDALKIDRNIDMGTDTAWLVPPNAGKSDPKSKVIALSVRELKPFDKKLGVLQEEYEQKVANLCDELVKKGYSITFVSTCTGIDGYRKDDRIVALRIKRLCTQAEQVTVQMDELNDVELGQFLSSCILTVSTRLHCAIISLNFGTPAFALNYEHKSKGIMQNLGLDELSIDFLDLMGDSLLPKIEKVLGEIDSFATKAEAAVEEEKKVASDFIARAVGQFEGKSV